MKDWQRDLALFALASPILAIRGAVRGVRQVQLLRLAAQPAFICRTCGSTVSLLGQWRCVCSYEYRGHVLRPCPLCGSFPRMIRCLSCGTTNLLPV